MKVVLVTVVQSFFVFQENFWILGSGNTLLIQFVFFGVLVVTIPLIFKSSESIEFYVVIQQRNARMSFCCFYTSVAGSYCISNDICTVRRLEL